jgi:hypothetical protein
MKKLNVSGKVVCADSEYMLDVANRLTLAEKV